MNNQLTLLNRLEQLLTWKKSKQYMADKLQISIEDLNKLLIELKNSEISKTEENKEDFFKNKNIDGFLVKSGWVKSKEGSFYISKKEEVFDVNNVADFQNFLAEYIPAAIPISNKFVNRYSDNLEDSCLVVNKQDAHLNKFDIDGNNSIEERFQNFRFRVSVFFLTK